jgi:hypothetical protein
MAAPKPDEAAIFNAARRIEDPVARRQYIAGTCGDDLALARRVEALLRMTGEDPAFLASPTKELGDFLGSLNERLTRAPAPGHVDDGPSPPRAAPAGYEVLGELGKGGM